jgi:predicted nucleic acid-binding protein
MAILMTADVLIQSERKKIDLDAWLRSHADEEIRLAAITVADLWRSVERATGTQRARRQSFVERVLQVFEVVPYSEKAAIEHARLSVLLEAAGQRISPHDLIFAATALESGASVLTLNPRRFSAIPRLTLLTPS